jgi:hypothetical protein
MGIRMLSLSGVAAGAIALTLAGGVATATAATAKATPQDVAAARAVVSAITRYDQTALGREGAMTGAAQALVAQVQAGCAGGIPAADANGTAQQQSVAFDLVFEGVFDLSLDALHPVHAPALALSHAFDRVHFSNRALTRGVHTIAALERALLAQAPSDLCADVKAADANGFTADPPGTTASLKAASKVLSASSGGVKGVLKKLTAYLTSKRDRAALTHLKAVDARYQRFFTRLGARWGNKLGSVLTTAPSSTGGFPTNPTPPAGTHTAMTSAFATL